MNRAMFAAATGMAAQQSNLETISDNLANAEVPGFKGSAATFAALTDGAAGMGTAFTGKQLVFEQGKLMKSGGAFDAAIDGVGFFTLKRPDGSFVYTRDGEFHRTPDGVLRNADGFSLVGVKVPNAALTITADPNGMVFVDTATEKRQFAGRIRLATFAAPERLRLAGSTLFEATKESGRAQYVNAGRDGGPKVAFGMLERSNVSVIESMMEILSAQRAYEANAKGVTAADEMMRVANNIQRN
jgi:flagellar basal-body rod protein FlgG